MFAKQGQKVSAKVNDVIISVSFCHAAAPLQPDTVTYTGAQTFLPNFKKGWLLRLSGLSHNILTLESFE